MSEELFDRLAARYDAWYESVDGKRLFDVEVQCLAALLKNVERPWLEVGVGTGRFAEALQVDEGVDTSGEVLAYAKKRGIKVKQCAGENLSFGDEIFGVVLLVVTVCFVKNPSLVIAEARRVLKQGGRLIIGLVPADSDWGRKYARQKTEGHPFYSAAEFYTVDQIVSMAKEQGLSFDKAVSVLTESPEDDCESYKRPIEGIVNNAGFVGLSFIR